MRICGDCRICCWVFPLPGLEKAGDEWCRFVSAEGCGVYRCGQPEVCREYACWWLEHEELTEECRPDRIGIVVTEAGTVRVAGEEMPVFVLNQTEPDACQRPRAKVWLDEMVAQGWVLMVIYGPDMHLRFDRQSYPGATEEAIEAALRHERSQDAEELRRLGAVDEEFRTRTKSPLAPRL